MVNTGQAIDLQWFVDVDWVGDIDSHWLTIGCVQPIWRGSKLDEQVIVSGGTIQQ